MRTVQARTKKYLYMKPSEKIIKNDIRSERKLFSEANLARLSSEIFLEYISRQEEDDHGFDCYGFSV